MKSVTRVTDKGIPFNQAIFKLNIIIIQRLNSPDRGRSNKSNTQTADQNTIILNTFINIISESDLQRHNLEINNIGILEKIISNGGRILNTIKPTIKYDISIVSSTTLRARIKIITEGPDSNFTIILKDRTLSSELSNVSEDFKNITVNNNNVKKPQLKKRKHNKYHYTKNIAYSFQSSITSNKKMDIIKYIQLLT